MMGKQRFAAFLLLLALSLTGCGGESGSSGGEASSQPPAQSEEHAGPAGSSDSSASFTSGESSSQSQAEEVPDEVLYLDDPESPYPLVMESWDLDLDGDGQEEQVELWAEKSYWGNETDNDWHEGEGMHPYSLRITRGKETDLYPLGWQPEDEPSRRPYYWSAESIWTQDQEGQAVLVLAMENMSAGGAGSIDLYAYSFLGTGATSLPIPEHYTLVTDQSDLYARLTVPETGYSEELDLAQWMLQRNVEPIYDDTGEEMIWPVAPQMIDGFYSAEGIEGGVRLRQYAWGEAHADGICDLVTDLSWSGGEVVVLQQYFDWYNEL